MDATSFEKIAQWSGGRLATGDPRSTVTTVCTDSRTLKAGDLFVALRGDNFDGHTFVAEASKRGAAGVIVEEFPAELPPGFAVVLVGNTLEGLQRLGAGYRRSLDIQVVGLTGSNGKTSTKDLTAAVLERKLPDEQNVKATWNNHIGVPLTLLRVLRQLKTKSRSWRWG